MLTEVAARDSGARRKLAEVYLADGQYDLAIVQFQMLLEANPRAADLHSMLGEALRKKGDFAGAIVQFREVVRLSAGAAGAMVALGMLLEEAGEKAEPEQLYAKVLAIEPRNIIALNNLALLKAERGEDLEGALAMALRARELAPGVDTISDTLGTVYTRNKMPDEAIAIFLPLVKKDGRAAMYHYHLAEAYWLKGDRVKAREECEAGLANAGAYEGRLRELLRKVVG
jgi:Flp pilus assembly protein TadD